MNQPTLRPTVVPGRPRPAGFRAACLALLSLAALPAALVLADPIAPTTIGFATASGAVGSYYNGGTDGAGNSGPNVGIVANTANPAGDGVLNGLLNPIFSVPGGFTGGFSVEAISVAVGFSISVYDGENATGTLLVQQGFSLNGNTTASVSFAGTAKSVVLSRWSGNPFYDNFTFGSTTVGTPVNEPPAVTTSAATGVTSATATLNATINPAGTATTAQFEYGTTPSYGSTASVTLSPNDGTTVQTVSANLSGLAAGTTYYYRATAVNGVGTRNGGELTFTTAPPPATALHFDGVNDSVDIPHQPGQLSYPFTVEAWVKTTDSHGLLVSKYVASSGNGWQMGTEAGKLTAWFFRPGGAGAIFPTGSGIVGATTINNDVWHHVAFVVDSTGGRLYVDGVSDGFSGWTWGTPGPATTTAPVRLGDVTVQAAYPFAGTLDEVRIWSAARSAADLQTYRTSELAIMPPCLVNYYKLNHGTVGANNAGVTSAVDETGGASGTLNNFALTGPTSNWTTGSGITAVTSVSDPTAPEINLTGNAVSITLGDTTPSPADHTDFGNASVLGSPVVRTFTVENTGPGASALNVSSIAVSGTHAANFTAGTLTPPGPIAGGSSATFTVTFAPNATGLRSATVTVNNDDCNESSYSFAVRGTGVNTAPTVARDNATVTVNEGQTAVNTGTFSDAEGNATVTLTASIGTITPNNGAGTWSWSYDTSVGQPATTVTITANDGVAAPVTTTFTLAINHAPTAINGPLTIVEDFDYGTSAGTLSGNGGAGFSSAWNGGSYTPTGLTFSSLTSPGGAWNGGSGSRNLAATLAAAGPITGDFLFSMSSAPGGRVQMFGLGGFNNQNFTIALAPANDSTPTGGIPIVGLNSGGFANVTAGAVALNTTYLYRFAYAGSSITVWILSAAQYDNFAPGGLTDAELNAATVGTGATEVTGRVTKTGNVTANMANLFTYTFGGGGVVMDRLRMTGTPVGASLVVAENAAFNTSAGTLTPSDADSGNTFTFALVSGTGDTDNASFNISGSTLRSSEVFNYEVRNSYSVRVRVTDQGGLSYETPLTVTISNVNEAVTDVALSPSSIAENNAANATVGTLSATDGDTGDTHTFTLVTGTGSGDNGSFTIAGNALRLTPSANFEVKNSYALRVRATDVGGLFFEKALTVTITDVNEAPTLSTGQLVYETVNPTRSGNNIAYSVNNSAALAAAPFSRVTYRMELTSGGTPYFAEASFDAWAGATVATLRVPSLDAPFVVQTDVNNLKVTSNYPGVVNATGQTGRLELWPYDYFPNANAGIGGSTATYDFDDTHTGNATYGSFQVHNLSSVPKQTVFAWNNHSSGNPDIGFGNSPTGHPDWTFRGAALGLTGWKLQIFIDGNTFSTPENSAVGTLVGTITPEDADVGDTFTYQLVSGTGDTDNASFTLSGNQVLSAAVFDYETKNSYAIRVRVTDAGGLSVEQAMTVSITNDNEAPTDIALSNATLAENNAANTTVGTLSATGDPDAGATHTFTLVSGTGSTDNGSFTIAGSALKLTPSADFETKPTYLLRVRATDGGGLFFEKALTVTITDVAENVAPTVARDAATVTVPEGTTAFNSGTFADANNDTVTITASVGTITQSGAGTWTHQQTLTQGGNPIELVLDSQENLYVANSSQNTIYKYSAAGSLVTSWSAAGAPTGVAVDSVNGWLYVALKSGHRIDKFTLSGTLLTSWGSAGSGDGQFNLPHCVAVDASGDVYVSDSFNSRIQVFSSSGTFLRKWGSSGSGNGQFNFPQGLRVSPGGTVYVADRSNHRVQYFDTAGTFLGKWGSAGSGNGQFNDPAGIGIDPGGNVVVGDIFNNRIQKFTATGTFVDKLGPSTAAGNLALPHGTAFPPSGRSVYIADHNNGRVVKFATPGGWNWSYTPADGAAGPTTVTITATDNGSPNLSSTTTFTLNVNNVAPTIALSGNATVANGTPYTLNLGAITDPGTDTVSAFSINWGDGNTENFTGNPASTAQTHTYATVGAKTITVTLTDEDGAFTGGTQSVTVENAAPVAGADGLNRPNTTTVAKVLKSVLLGNDTDADSDPLTLTAVGNALPAGATVTITGNFVVYTAPANNAGNGSFEYTLSDGTHSVTGTVTVTETTTSGGGGGTPNYLTLVPSGDDFVVTFLGVPGGSFRVQYTTSTAPPYVWNEFAPQAIYTAAPNGVFTHTDVNPPGPVRFYRAVSNP